MWIVARHIDGTYIYPVEIIIDLKREGFSEMRYVLGDDPLCKPSFNSKGRYSKIGV